MSRALSKNLFVWVIGDANRFNIQQHFLLLVSQKYAVRVSVGLMAWRLGMTSAITLVTHCQPTAQAAIDLASPSLEP